MIKLILLIGTLSGLFFFFNKRNGEVQDINNTESGSMTTPSATASIYDLKINGITGDPLDLSQFKGKKIMFVNVASECGYTPQYTALQKVYEEYKDKLIIIGCPSNDFGGQEPGTSTEIVNFCKLNYGVTFPLTEKVGIKSNTHILYQWLTQKAMNGVSDGQVKWNFTKFLIDEKGNWVKNLPSGVKPDDAQIIDWIKA
jgi:glutathione peroxidase